MIFVIGGIYEGKTEYVKNTYGKEITDGASCELNCKDFECINNYHILIKRLIENGTDPLKFTLELIEEKKDLIIIMDEIGCGIVPIEKSERMWRETTGRIGCIIAEKSEKTVRIFCGIPQILKEKTNDC